MSAMNRTRVYTGSRGDGTVTNVATRTVLRELCSMSNTAGIVYASQDRISARSGLTVRMVKRALARLRRDGWITELRRGVGNNHGIAPRPTVLMIARLPDEDGILLPLAPVLADNWLTFQRSKLWASARRYERPAWRQAQTARIAAADHPVNPVDKGVWWDESDPYKVPVRPLQGASAGPLLNDASNQEEESVVSGDPPRPMPMSGGRPAHWRVSRSSAALAVVPDMTTDLEEEMDA